MQDMSVIQSYEIPSVGTSASWWLATSVVCCLPSAPMYKFSVLTYWYIVYQSGRLNLRDAYYIVVNNYNPLESSFKSHKITIILYMVWPLTITRCDSPHLCSHVRTNTSLTRGSDGQPTFLRFDYWK